MWNISRGNVLFVIIDVSISGGIMPIFHRLIDPLWRQLVDSLNGGLMTSLFWPVGRSGI